MTITDAFKGKTLVITGGTGSFGSTVLKHASRSAGISNEEMGTKNGRHQ